MTMLSNPASEDNRQNAKNDRGKMLRILAKMTRSDKTSSYTRMKDGAFEKRVKSNKDGGFENGKSKNSKEADKENRTSATNAGGKEKKPKRKGWKRFRHAALVTCRYIGMGVSQMGAAGAAYPATDYQVDPKTWNKTFSPSYNRTRAQTPHWTNNVLLFAGW